MPVLGPHYEKNKYKFHLNQTFFKLTLQAQGSLKQIFTFYVHNINSFSLQLFGI